MEKILSDYLEKMEKYLRPVAVSERVDIIKEIKSEMQELQGNGIPAEQIIERLGNPKDLAKAYLGDLLSKESRFSWNRFLIVYSFYSLVGFSGMFVLPCLGVIAIGFIVCGIATPILIAVKMIDHVFALGIPYMENFGVWVGGSTALNPGAEFIISLVVGTLLCWGGLCAWKLLLLYCRKVSKAASSLSVLRK